jgi:hypothetical protein
MAMPSVRESAIGNPMRERFAREYLKDGNATGAARRAGYNSRSAGSQLIGMENVQARIRTLHQSQLRRLQLEADELVTWLSRVVRLKPADFYGEDGLLLDPKDWPEDVAACMGFEINANGVVERNGKTVKDFRIEGFRISTQQKLYAAALLARHHNLFAKEAEDMGRGMSQGFVELVQRAKDAGGGVQGLLTPEPPAALPGPG